MYTRRVEVSVLLPVRDAASTIDAAIASALADLEGVACELVLVDDRSSDGSSSLLRRWAEREPRVRVIEGPGRGIAAALNAGLAVCRAPLLARMDADDLWRAGRWAAQREALADPQLAAVGGRVEIFGDGPLTDGMRHYQAWLSSVRTPEDVFRERYVESPLVHPAAVIRRAALESVGGWREAEVPEDYALWLALLERGAKLANVDACVLRWRDSPHRLTRTDGRYSLAAHAALKAEHLAREPWARGGVRIAGAGPTGLRLARLLRAHDVEVRGFIEVHPRKIGTRIEGVAVEGYDALGGPDGVHLLVAVGTKGAREEVRAFLEPRHWIETRDFTCVS